MPDTVREKIFLDLVTTLSGISVANGYENNIASVERWNMNGNNKASVPAIIINSGPEKDSDSVAYNLTHCLLTVFLELWVRQNETESAATATDRLLNSLLGDIKKALQTDVTRGGVAVDTEVTDIESFETIEGQQHAGLIITLEIEYRHQQQDPKVAG